MIRQIALVLFVAIPVAATGCKSELNPAFCAAHPDDERCTSSPANDGGVDGAISDGTDAVTTACLGSGALQVCFDAPTGPLMLDSQTVQSGGGGPLCAANQPNSWTEHGQKAACFIVATDITFANTVTLRGGRPIVFVATNSITVNAVILDSAKRTNGFIPAGFSSAAPDCPAAVAPVSNASGGGGGAGGTLGGKGADGGAGQGTVSAGGKAGAPSISILHGGCIGQTGGDGSTAGNGGIGGFGGGAVYLIAGGDISFGTNAEIHANGAAGLGGGAVAGGGGGGSGGMIALWAGGTIVIGTGVRLSANGGGGASGATNQPGSNGTDPNPDTPMVAATGGSLGGAGTGGTGSVAATDPTAGMGVNNGGGGGGGGAGIIYTNRTLTAATISPSSTPIP